MSGQTSVPALGRIGVGLDVRPAVGPDGLGPGRLDERPPRQQLAVGAVERVVEAVAVGEEQRLLAHAVDRRLGQHRHLRGIPVVGVVRGELVVPLEHAGVGVERDHRVGVEVVALAVLAVEVRAGVAGAPVDQVQRRVERAGHPRGAAAALPRVAFPALAALLARAGHHPEAPGALAGGGVEGVDEAADAVLGAGDADHDLVLDDERRRGGAVAFLVVVDHRVPHHRAGLHVEGQQVRVERVHVEAVAEHGEAAVDAAAADVHALGQVADVAPDLAPGAGVDRPRRVVRPGDVHHAVEDDRRRLELAELRGLERPLRRQLADVGRGDLGQRAVALAAVVAAVVEPRRRDRPGPSRAARW